MAYRQRGKRDASAMLPTTVRCILLNKGATLHVSPFAEKPANGPDDRGG